MILKLSGPDRAQFLLAFVGLIVACAPAPRVFLQYGDEFRQAELENFLAANPLAAGENIKVTTLGQGPAASHHIVQIRDREVPHVHKAHDATVTVLQGRGYLMMEKRRVELAAGDVVYIPRGAVHYFVNTHSEPTVAFAVYSPPFDGKDTIPVKVP
jgi:mannose-6-phosphate isomerase-like protein (cupin superfamily)